MSKQTDTGGPAFGIAAEHVTDKDGQVLVL